MSTTNIYRVYYDGFRYGYEGFFSSLEKAIEILPKCPKFLRAVKSELPRHNSYGTLCKEPDWEHNKEIPLSVELNTKGYLKVFYKNYKILVSERIETPEVKEPGKPYIPPSTTYKELQPEYIDAEPNYIVYVEEVPIDSILGV